MTTTPQNVNIPIPDFITYLGMTFGEMIEAGFDWGSTEWTSGVYALTPEALSFYEPLVDDRVASQFYDLVPGDDRPSHFRRNLIREIIIAMNKYGPILETLYMSDTMQDGTDGTHGVINIQDDGQEGHREATFNSQYPQSMLQHNIQDYGSSGTSQSYGTTNYQGNLNAVLQALGTETTPSYDDALNLVLDSVERSGVFSSFIY